MKSLVVFLAVLTLASYFVLSQTIEDEKLELYLDKSIPYVGTDIARQENFDGSGIVIAVIDTGIDYNHPDLFGFGPDGKVIGGWNFIQNNGNPIDTNGHGTQVAGVIAADGQKKGIAPKAKLLAYKVSEDGEGVSSDLIIQAIERAIEDGADIINISLGVNKTNSKIEDALTKAHNQDIFIVTAAGNDGPLLGTIGSPGQNAGTLTVGSTYNNLTSSLVATLNVNDKDYTVIPMVGSSHLEEPITAEIIFGNYAKQENFAEIDAAGKIILAERGSDIPEELLYFSTKEDNAANAGAKALIVFNNQPGIFLGELIHEFVEPDYTPRIPVVSMDRKDGLELKEILKESTDATMHLFYNPDFVAHFSSRGPVSSYYIKPDIVAPGAYINTTQIHGGYNFTSGTSYAAPHVSGAAALLMQKNPDIHHHQLKSILMTTSETVSDSLGARFSVNEAGTGRLDIAEAFGADLVIIPPNQVLSLSSEKNYVEDILQLDTLKGQVRDVVVEFDGPEIFDFDYILENNELKFRITALEENFETHEARIILHHDNTEYTVPVVLRYTDAAIDTTQQEGTITFDVLNPQEWSFAKITVSNIDNGNAKIVTITPTKDSEIQVYEKGTYWIDAKIRVDDATLDAYDKVTVTTPAENNQVIDFDIPQRQIIIVAGIIVLVGVVGLVFRRRSTVNA